ncbi:MAG: STAS domain-containing protein [Candidatus Hinthialibacter antarcticus]|nr:STAS domain-containing protein [Candidatus Hinthialibacter antarcticus]
MPDNKLYICVNKENQEVFFASMINRKDFHANLRSSHAIDKGMSLIMIEAPPDWDGKPIPAESITKSSKSFEAHVIYNEGRGSFRVRILSGDQKDMVERVRSGSIKKNILSVKVREVGAIYELDLKGRLGVDSVGKIQRALRELPEKIKPLLFDFAGVTHISNDCFGVLSETLESYREKGHAINILVPPDSHIEEVMSKSRLSAIIEVYSDREQAVTALLMRTFS